MKNFKDILFSTLMLLIMFSCSSNDAAEVVDVEEEVTIVEQVEVQVPVAGVTETSTSVKP